MRSGSCVLWSSTFHSSKCNDLLLSCSISFHFPDGFSCFRWLVGSRWRLSDCRPLPPVRYLRRPPGPPKEEKTRLMATFLCHIAPPIEILSVIVVVGNIQFLRQAQVAGPLSRSVGEYDPLMSGYGPSSLSYTCVDDALLYFFTFLLSLPILTIAHCCVLRGFI